MTMSSPIAVFDSGIGGLTVVQALRQQMPEETIVYLGDTARVPYGTKSASTIQRYAIQAAEKLASYKPKLLIIACNTASAYGLEILKRRWSIPVLGVIEASARLALTHSHSIAVLATRATVASDIYPQTLKAMNTAVSVHSMAAPLLVSLAEEGWWDNSITEDICRYYLADLPASVNTVILGCTHFPVFLPILERIRPDLNWIDSGTPLAKEVRKLLSNTTRSQAPTSHPTLRLLVTDESTKLHELASRFLGESAPPIELINI
jgi:glutamate racemase